MSKKLAPIATAVIYEDDHVRVWNQVVPAGGTIERHVHDHDYFLLNVSGEGPIEVTFHEGTGGSLGDRLTFSPKPGTADYVPRGHVETARNLGGEYRAVLVELKRP
ncbi:MAG: hypothetical protein R3E86_06015 [Pseudomonadales bacterium]